MVLILSIGLSIRVRLLRSLSNRFKIDIKVKPGSHQSEEAGQFNSTQLSPDNVVSVLLIVNKQLNDKERVAAALENSALLDVVERCLSTANRRGSSGP